MLRGVFCALFQNRASLRGRESGDGMVGWSWNSWWMHVEGRLRRAGWLAAAVVALVGRSNRFPQAFGESIAATKAGEDLDNSIEPDTDLT